MIIAKLTDHKRYEALHPLLKQLFDYVCSHDFTDTPVGRIALQGDDLFVNLDESQLVEKDKQRLEVHRKYIDVHIPLTSAEEFGWRPLSTLGNSDAPFNCERDIAFYTAKSDKWFTLCPGEFCIVFPEDAHAPIVGNGVTRKLVGKIRL